KEDDADRRFVTELCLKLSILRGGAYRRVSLVIIQQQVKTRGVDNFFKRRVECLVHIRRISK
ncbi:unnamed protein product, partial [Brassica oleracea]